MSYAHAADLTSTSFIIRDPVVGTGGGYATSASFEAYSTGNTLGSGEADSASFKTRYGFLNYPEGTVPQILTMSISDNTLSFGPLSSIGPRYATTSTGSVIDVAAHTITAGSNAVSGYVLTYRGAVLTSGANTIAAATSIGGSGTPGTPQFGISIGTTGTATIPSAYQQSGPTRTFAPNTTTVIANTSSATLDETFDMHYLTNISSTTPAGQYSTLLTYVVTANF